MLWYKAWLETRARFGLMFGVVLFSSWYLCPEILGKMAVRQAAPGSVLQVSHLSLNFLWVFWPMIAVLLAGAGINTQTFTGLTSRPHGSMLFTLSLPVSRRRLLMVRAAAGGLETMFLIAFTCALLWSISPMLRAQTGLGGMCRYLVATMMAASVFYCLSLFYATFLNETWQSHACFITLGAIIMFRVLPIPTPIRVVVRSLSNIPELVNGSFPWTSLLLCGLASGCLFFAAVQIVERKRY